MRSLWVFLIAVFFVWESASTIATTQAAPTISFTTFVCPGADITQAFGINNTGQIVGMLSDSGKKLHGFLRATNSTCTTVDVQGAANTLATGINDAGLIVGSFTDASNKYHGFLRTADGAFTTIDVPNAASTGVRC